MNLVRSSTVLSYEGAMALIRAAIERASEMGVPQCIAVVDHGGNLIAFARMDGAKYLSFHTALTKARAAASIGRPTWEVDEQVGVRLALASDGALTALKAGVPVFVDGKVVGAIGVGSGTAEDDMDVARHAIAAFGRALDSEGFAGERRDSPRG